MKRKFTILTAALALLAILAIPMGMRGQTTVTDHMTALDLAATSTTYTDFSNVKLTSEAVYAGQSAKSSTGGIQLRSKNSNSGIVTTTSGGTIASITITVESGSNTIDVYGKNTAYSLASDLYGNAGTQGTKLGSLSATGTITVTDDYEYVGIRSNNGAVYITSIDFVWNTSSTPSTVATPTFSPASGTEFGNDGLEVSISCETTPSYIYYTLDGSTPSDDGCPMYEGPIAISETTTIKAIAYDDEDNASAVATATYTYVDPNAPGTQNNPYTVAQARAAIDAGTGLTNVYATGIISQVDSYNSNYNSITYWISDDGTTTSDQLEVYSGKGLNNTNFSSINDVEVGATVVVYGTLKKYNSIYEFDKNNYLVSYEAPLHDVATPTFSPAAGTYAEAQTLTISCATDGASIYYTTDGTDPSDASTPYNGALNISTTTTIKAIAYVNRAFSTIATATYHINSQDNPYTVAQALAFNEYPANGIYVHGIVSTAPSELLSGGYLTYYISDDGETTTQLQVYKGKDLEQAAFTSVDNIQVGDIVTIYGNVKIYNNEKEFDKDNYLVSFERPASTTPELAVTPTSLTFSYVEGTVNIEGQNITFTGSNLTQNVTVTMSEGVFSMSDPATGDSYESPLTLTPENGEINAIITVTIDDNLQQGNYSGTITVSWEGEEDITIALTGMVTEQPDIYNGEGTFNKVTSLADLEDGGYYVLYGVNGNYTGAMNTTLSGGTMGATAVEIVNNAITNPGKAIVWKLEKNGDNWDLFNEEIEKYCYITGTSSKSFALSTDKTETNYNSFTVSVEDGNYSFVGGSNRMIAHYQNDFRTYTSGNTLYLFKLGEPSSEPFITVAPETMDLDAEAHTLGNETAFTITYQNIEATGYQSFTLHYYDEAGEEIQLGDDNWHVLGVTGSNAEGYKVSGYVTANEGEARTAYFKVSAAVGDNTVYSNLVTINQAEYEAPFEGGTYTLANSIESGKTYIIASELFVDEIYAMGADRGNNRGSVSVAIDENTITVEPGQQVYEFTITSLDEPEGFYSIYDPRNEGYLYAAGGTSNNHLKTYTDLDNKGQWTITIGDEGVASIVANFGNDTEAGARNTMRFNGTNNPPIFSCYESGKQSDVYLYVKVEASETHTLTIDGYTDDNVKDGYYLIASPVTVDPATVKGMTYGDFDLYYFDQSQDDEWRNYEAQPFNLEPGKGYLYAKKATADTTTYTFNLTGTPNQLDGFVSLILDNNDKVEFQGWNLIGNPFGEAASLDMPFYRMNTAGTELEAVTEIGSTVNAMEGVFVIAEMDPETGDVPGAQFTVGEGTTTGEGKLVMNVGRNGNAIDRAIVRFDEGRQLPKFQLNPNHTKLYVTEGNQDLAVVRSASKAEMPVSFKAENNGTYTISVNAEDIDMEYLHLIDNMTGADIDLLETPSYSFNAKVTDYANRFRLMFRANDSENNNAESFAFYNNGNITVNGNGILNIVDVLGRTVLTQELTTANCQLSTANIPAGVYTLQLVNGDKVKTQKVVVK